jgi:hypothetical protein
MMYIYILTDEKSDVCSNFFPPPYKAHMIDTQGYL